MRRFLAVYDKHKRITFVCTPIFEKWLLTLYFAVFEVDQYWSPDKTSAGMLPVAIHFLHKL